MSLGNNNMHQRGEIPEIVKLPNNRIRVVRRFHKFTREDIDNAGLGSTMGDFGDLDTTNEQITNQGYANCKLISVEVDNRFNQQANADNPVLVKTYETLTDSFVEITDPQVEFLENGSKKITKIYRADSGTTNSNTVGTTLLNPEADPSDGITLASSKIEDNTAYAELTEIYLKGNVVLNVSEDKVGSQLAVINEVFKPSNESSYVGVNADGVALSGYLEANKEKSNFEGIPTVSFTFLKSNAVLSEQTDMMGSLEVTVIETFKPTSAGTTTPTLSGFTLVKLEESDVAGIPTQKAIFYKNNAIISESVELVGSEKAIIIKKFKAEPTIGEALTSSGITLAEGETNPYTIAKKEQEGKAGVEIYTYTFLRKSILSVSQVFGDGLKKVSVEAFNMTEAEVDGELLEVTTGHLLISRADTNRNGIKTTTFEYQLSSSFVEDYELNGLKRITLTELSATAFTAQTVGAKGANTLDINLYLSTQEMDNGGTIKVRDSVWIEGGKLSTKKVNEGDGIYEVTNVFLGEIPTGDEAVGPVVSLEEDNIGGLKTITQVELQNASEGSIVTTTTNTGGTTVGTPISEVGTLHSFTYPGVVEIDQETLSGDGSTYNFFSKDLKLTAPATAIIEATVKTFFKTTTAISYSSSDGLWSPRKWASSESKGIGWHYSPFYISQGYRGYRAKPTNASEGYAQTIGPSTAMNGTQSDNWDMLSGKRLYAGTGYKISCTGGPENPEGNEYTLDYRVELAFNDTSNVNYYKHTEVVATIPLQVPSTS